MNVSTARGAPFARKIGAVAWSPAVQLSLFALIAALVVASRWPDVVLHANFWGEDGWYWYPDARALGWAALLKPWTGYLQTVSRLVALAAQPFPLAWAPTIFAAAAISIQVGAATYLVSDRMSAASPSQPARVLFALIYLLLPDSAEVYANLTNVQWHLAFFAFLVLASTPAQGWRGAALDAAVLLLSGLSGPFSLFLAPVAVLRAWHDRNRTTFWRAAVVLGCCVVQVGFLAASDRAPASASMLGARPGRLVAILATRVVLSALVGRHGTLGVLGLWMWRSHLLPVLATGGGLALTVLACVRGSSLVRWGLLAAGLSLAAALISPVPLTGWAKPWVMLTNPDHCARYFVLPMLAWVGVLFTLAADRNLMLRGGAICLLGLLLIELPGDWHLPPISATHARTDFVARATAFAAAPSGTRMEFPVNPPGARPMVLVK